MMRNRLFFGTLILFFTVPLYAQQTIDRTVPADADARVDIEILNGSLNTSGLIPTTPDYTGI